MNEQTEYTISGKLLLDLRQGLIEAMYDEDGLDGAEGAYLLLSLNSILGFEVSDHLERDIPGGNESDGENCPEYGSEVVETDGGRC